MMLNSMLVVAWLMVVAMSAASLAEGVTTWPLLVPAVLAGIAFSWFFLRITGAAIEHRYATREVVAAGALAVVAAALGGADPMGWGVLPVAWLSVAVLGVSKRQAQLVGLATFVVCGALSVLGILTGRSLFSVGGGSLWSSIAVSCLVYAIWCLAMPGSNRMWAWIWRLANEAHEGREAHARLAVAEERLRFARDLHDLVGHQLSAIAVKAELAVRLAEAGPARSEMTEVNALTRQALRELRQAVRGYRELDLSAELGSVRGVLEAAGVRCELNLPYRDLPEGLAPVFAYAVREAVTNVLKHSTATYCGITLRFTQEEAELVVRNDGVARRQAADLGSGLTGMGERLAAVGGKLTARPTGDGQFVLNAVVSLPIRG